MSMKPGYIFVPPENIDAETVAKNIHIFQGDYDTDKKLFRHKKSCCGNCSIKKDKGWSKIASADIDIQAKSEARKIALDYEDTEKTVCGRCVAHLYNKEI